MVKALFILTGARVWTMKDGTAHPTGFWAEEFIQPHTRFAKAGLEISVATPGGIYPQVDPLSLSPNYYKDNEIAEQKAYLQSQDALFKAALTLEEVKAQDYDIVFQVGGHGPMQDLAVHPTIGKLFVDVLADQTRTLAAVCHGPAAFLSAVDADGKWAFAGRKLTGFSNEEESAATFAGNAPWLLEDRLRLAGAQYQALPAWTPHVVEDGNLITGQQQVSAGITADAVLRRHKLSA